MSDFEDGEIVSGGEGDNATDVGLSNDDAPYTPLVRPAPTSTPRGSSSGLSTLGHITRPRSSTNSSMMVNIGDMDNLDDASSLTLESFASSSNAAIDANITSNAQVQSSDDDDDDDLDNFVQSSDSDSSDCGLVLKGSEVQSKSSRNCKLKKKLKLQPKTSDEGVSNDGGGWAFQRMAAEFQKDRERQGLPTRSKSRKNNVWGSFLQEETLTQEMTAVGVGRSLRDVDSDRGAETYDYVRAQEFEAERRAQRDKEERSREERGLDEDLKQYWTGKSENDEMETDERRSEAIQAGRKRSVRERLGSRQRGGHRSQHRMDSGELDEMSIPPPGKPRSIPDVEQESRLCASDIDLGKEMATRLSEPKTQLIVGVVELVGRQVALELFDRTRKTEAEGGMMIKNGERRRTPGGIFLQLLRDDAASDERIDDKKVKHFFAQCNRPHHQKGKGRRPKEAFGTELELFKKLSQERKKKEEQQEAEMAVDKEEEEEVLKPLPDILSTISKRFEEATKNESGKPSSSTAVEEVEEGELAAEGEEGEKKLEAFVEPEAPPNSVERVERTISAYDEDEFLNNDTEDIELF